MNVDAIYVITLSEAKERHKNMLELYPENSKIQLIKFERDNSNPTRGCFESHQKVIENAKKLGHSKILIMEDDASPLYSWNDIVKVTNKLLLLIEFNPKWKYLMLGSMPIRTKKTKFNELVEVMCAVEAHAYIVNLKNVNPHIWKGDPVDLKMFCDFDKDESINDSVSIFRLLNKVESNVYLSRKNLFIQKPNISYIDANNVTGRIALTNIYRNYDNIIELSLYTNIYLFTIITSIILTLLLLCIPIIILAPIRISSYYVMFLSIFITILISILLMEHNFCK
jgi:hypothetical protein